MNLTNFFDIIRGFFPHKIATRSELSIGMLMTGDFCIAYNEKEDFDVWGYMLYDNNQKLYIWNSNNQIVFDGYIHDAPKKLFYHGEVFSRNHSPQLMENMYCDPIIFSCKNLEVSKRLKTK